MADSPHQLQSKIEFLHQENQQLRDTVEDLQSVIALNKQQLRAMIDQDVGNKLNQQKTIRDSGDSTIKALQMVMSEQQKEIDYLKQCLERVSKERDFAQGKALISEEITYAAEKSEKKLISELESNIQELNSTISKQANKIQILEKQSDQREDITGSIVKYRDVIHPNTATILLHDEMEVLHQLIVRLQLQLNYFKSVQLKLVTLVHNILTNLQLKIQGELVDLEEDHENGLQEFQKILELIQQCKLPNIDIPIRSQLPAQSPINTDFIGSPIPSPFPAKAPQINKHFANLNQTYDGIPAEEKKQVVPKLNLSKAFQIQQINAKRSTQQVKMNEEQMHVKIRKLEQDLEESKKSIQREMLLCKHFEIENEQMRRHIKQIEANNEVLIKSNMNLNQKWQKIQKSFLFYKTFFVEHKDQYTQLQQLVQSEKEKVNSCEEQSDLNFNSARLHSKKETTIRKRPNVDSTQIVYHPTMFQDASLMEVEKALNRVNQSYTMNNERLHSESMIDQSAIDCDLGHACMDRRDESDSGRNTHNKGDAEWRELCKREWTYMATQVHQKRSKEMVQQIKASIPTQKLTDIKQQ